MRSYGVLCVRAMPNGSGNPENTYICPHTKEMKILNRVAWLIRKVSFSPRHIRYWPIGFARIVKLILPIEGCHNNQRRGDELQICLSRGVEPQYDFRKYLASLQNALYPKECQEPK